MTLHGRQAEATQEGPDGKAVWSRGFGAWGRTGSDGNAARLNHSTGGFLLGTDARLSQHWRAGALAGYSRTRFDVGNASGSSDNFHLGLYGGAQWGRLGLRLGAAHTWHALRVSRPVAFAGYADGLKSDYRGHDPGLRRPGLSHRHGGGGRRAFRQRGLCESANRKDRRAGRRGGAARARTGYRRGLHDPGLARIGRVHAGPRGRDRARVGGLAPCAGRYDAGIGTAICGGDAFTAAGVPIARNAALIEAGMDVTLGRGPRWAWRIRG